MFCILLWTFMCNLCEFFTVRYFLYFLFHYLILNWINVIYIISVGNKWSFFMRWSVFRTWAHVCKRLIAVFLLLSAWRQIKIEKLSFYFKHYGSWIQQLSLRISLNVKNYRRIQREVYKNSPVYFLWIVSVDSTNGLWIFFFWRTFV